VGEVDAARSHADQDLAGTGDRVGPVAYLERLRRARARDPHRSHGRALTPARSACQAPFPRVAPSAHSDLSAPMTLALIQHALAAAYPDRDCVVTPTRRLSYAQVADRARRLASVLHAHGLGAHRERPALANHESGQDHVGLYMLNAPEYVEAMLG